jgi:hypothetical protein
MSVQMPDQTPRHSDDCASVASFRGPMPIPTNACTCGAEDALVNLEVQNPQGEWVKVAESCTDREFGLVMRALHAARGDSR